MNRVLASLAALFWTAALVGPASVLVLPDGFGTILGGCLQLGEIARGEALGGETHGTIGLVALVGCTAVLGWAGALCTVLARVARN